MIDPINFTNAVITNFSVAEAVSLLKPLSFFIIGIVIYAIFIFEFYRFIGRKDIFKLDLEKYTGKKFSGVRKAGSSFFYFIKHLVVYPVFTFIWFLVLVAFLVFLSVDTSISTIMLLTMALVASIRITAYYNEDLSKDIAKTLPFALLVILITNMASFSFLDSIDMIVGITSFWKTIIYYLAFIVVLELFLRIGYSIRTYLKSGEKAKKEKPEAETD